ncbi:MAG: UPF0182 family protein [Xenococcaceae cyanobacterium MO_207.B15]|nr:UPF0182 family protein [Xenococcaceae cyanobacterium MO_207.B15]
MTNLNMKLSPAYIALAFLVAVVGFSVSGTVIHLLTLIWWFDTVGFSQVLWTRLTWQILIWVITLVVYILFLWVNYWLATRGKGKSSLGLIIDDSWDIYSRRAVNYFVVIVVSLVGLMAAFSSVNAWEIVLKYLHSSSFGSSEPIFGQDIGFYVFRLPFYETVYYWLWGLIVSSAITSCFVYGFNGSISSYRLGRRGIRISKYARVHLSLLASAIAFLGAWGFWLARYQLLYSPEGVVFGAGYTDVHARLLAYQVLSILALLIAVLLIVSTRQQKFTLPLSGIGLFFVTLLLVNYLYPWFMEQFIVNPNELAKEKPYIEHNIKLTQAAYHLDDVQRQNYAAEANLNLQSLANNQSTIDNIRLWDYRPLLSTYQQLQEIRLYYKFRDVDIDRYHLNGNYQQVMLSARELAFERVPQEAQTWVNQRLKYTHGYGLVMSPVNRVTSDGLPSLYLKNIPPVSTVDLEISQPAIYYGEETDNYIFTGTTTPEFDYPLGDANAFTNYKGKGGVPLSSIWRRFAYAYDLHSLQILISNYFTNQSRIHYYREIPQRIKQIAPFLHLDRDPYLAVINGKLQWIVDAYTISSRYPYSEPVVVKKILPQSSRVNYIRNSVKVVVDAYDGTIQFFVVDEDDPVLATYRQIFPELFISPDAIPSEIKAHFRYPHDLFELQAKMYLSYHMSDPEVFYNREDLWAFPRQIYSGDEVVVEPYYLMVKLPGEQKAGFILILPFTPAKKDNAIAWMAARSNGEDYGKLLLYSFPKHKLVYGTRQIEARIDQTPKISMQFTLWSQAGSKVIRGDLLVIPIEQSLLYIEPVYLRAEQGELPSLKRVIVAYDKAVVMEKNLEQSLSAIFGTRQLEKRVSSPITEKDLTLIESALRTYQKAQEALRQGNWAEYGRYQQELGDILQQLNQKNNSLLINE